MKSNEKLDINLTDTLGRWKDDLLNMANLTIQETFDHKTEELSKKINKAVNGANKAIESQKVFIKKQESFFQGFSQGAKLGKILSVVAVIGFIIVALYGIFTVKNQANYDIYNTQIKQTASLAEQNNKILSQIIDINSENLSKYVNCYFSGVEAEKLYYWTIYNNANEKYNINKNFNEWLSGYETFKVDRWLNTLDESDKEKLRTNMRELGIIDQKVGFYMKQLKKDASFFDKAWAFLKDYNIPVLIVVFLLGGFLLGGYCQRNTIIKIWK